MVQKFLLAMELDGSLLHSQKAIFISCPMLFKLIQHLQTLFCDNSFLILRADSLVNTATRPWNEKPRNQNLVLGRGKRLFSPLQNPDWLWGLSSGYQQLFPQR
jgi:hypothetical protein